MKRDIRNYDVFKLSHKLVLVIYRMTSTYPQEEKYGLSSQLRRSSYSVPMHLIEGGMRPSEKEFLHFINIAHGSLAELFYQLDLSMDLGYINIVENKSIKEEYEPIGKMLTNLEKRIKSSSQKPAAKG